MSILHIYVLLALKTTTLWAGRMRGHQGRQGRQSNFVQGLTTGNRHTANGSSHCILSPGQGIVEFKEKALGQETIHRWSIRVRAEIIVELYRDRQSLHPPPARTKLSDEYTRGCSLNTARHDQVDIHPAQVGLGLGSYCS